MLSEKLILAVLRKKRTLIALKAFIYKGFTLIDNFSFENKAFRDFDGFDVNLLP